MQPIPTDYSQKSGSRTNVIFGGILAVLVMLISPSLAAASVLGLIGFACARSALVYRQTGWVLGLVFGVALMVFVIGGAIVTMYYMSTIK
jgi:hypothetical protein